MDKQGSMRQTQRPLSRSGAIATRRTDTSKALLQQGSHQRLDHSASSGAVNDSGAAANHLASEHEQQLHGTNAAPANASSFDKLEQLGPSLLEVLTLVHPPQPRAQQEQLDAQRSQQQTGGDSTQESDSQPSQQMLHDTTNNSSTAALATPSAKFDVCVSRSALLGKVTDASIDNSRKIQEYFAKILAKLEIEATGIVLLQESTILLYLETTAEQLLMLMRQLQQQKIIDPTSMRVLASCDNNPERLLQGLYFKKVTIARASGSDGDSSEWSDETFQHQAVETFLNIIKFVKKIGAMAPVEIRKCLTNLAMSDQVLLPANGLVLWLLERDEFMALNEFINVFDSPIELELESERVWPVHPLIHY